MRPKICDGPSCIQGNLDQERSNGQTAKTRTFRLPQDPIKSVGHQHVERRPDWPKNPVWRIEDGLDQAVVPTGNVGNCRDVSEDARGDHGNKGQNQADGARDGCAVCFHGIDQSSRDQIRRSGMRELYVRHHHSVYTRRAERQVKVTMSSSDSEKTVPMTHETSAVQALGRIDAGTRAVVSPIHISSTYIRDADNQYRSGFSYGRADNETVRELEAIVAMLENGQAALAFGSGMSAAVALCAALTPGSRIVAPTVMYWALRNWLATDARDMGLNVCFVDMADLASVNAAVSEHPTQIVWIETPSNPMWGVIDIAAVAAIAHRAGARFVVDSTCASPVLTRPLDLGADVVMHSASKYLNGHSDVIAGVLVTRHQDDFWKKISRVRSSHGMLLGPFEAFLVIRGIRTLHLRVRASCVTALDLAHRLTTHS
ncbi:MAG: cystathionine gamma-synthase, partial [Hyphomicrobiales bacterium]|nr:cystathionine gamma-synthase [Hyphomicrobiales bacterium]